MAYKKLRYNGIELQVKNKCSKVFIVRNGSFYQAFNEAAHLIAAVCGYKVFAVDCKLYPEGAVKVGFPLDSLDRVEQALYDTYPNAFAIVRKEIDIIEWDVLSSDFQFPVCQVAYRLNGIGLTSDVMSRILGINLADTTPMQALTLLIEIQQQCRSQINADDEKV